LPDLDDDATDPTAGAQLGWLCSARKTFRQATHDCLCVTRGLHRDGEDTNVSSMLKVDHCLTGKSLQDPEVAWCYLQTLPVSTIWVVKLTLEGRGTKGYFTRDAGLT